ncbi:sulfatase-like hydrolase/transferase [Variovorax sp. GT1P44]|uniref:sulfatase-like hydrolase/transferase n=1 Tax=Variovorax sp. GT1P44 TaxID=3443742 RepID=UPI003F4885B0
MIDVSPRAFPVTRRSLLASSVAAIAGGALPMPGTAPAAWAQAPAVRTKGSSRPNILFVFTDQERYFSRWPAGLGLPGHERMQRTGVRFMSHYCPAVMCTSSRAVLMTGLQTADNRMFENSDAAWVKPLATSVPTVGHMMRKAGYYTAYKGKWHLNKDFESADPDRLFTTEMEAYGFSDYGWPGDLLAHAEGGHKYDHMIAGSAISWMRNKGQSLSKEGKPWFMTVSLVNPHDIMYLNTDAPGEHVQDNGRLMLHSARVPDHADYRRKWKAPLPANLRQPLNEPGRPAAHAEFDRAWGYTLGRIPMEDGRWQMFSDYYLNCIRAVDAQVMALLNELDALKLSDRTMVIFTSDHGEMGGAHGLRGKGAFVYEENLHLPFYVVHPDVRGGQDCRALSSHIDLAPTLLAAAGMDRTRSSEVAGRDLPGKDLGPAIGNPRGSAVNEVREQVLFTFSGLAQTDAELMRVIAEGTAAGKDQKTAIKDAGFKPDLRKRGTVRATFDGRYKFARYCSPVQRHRPTTLDQLYQWNDVELFDLQSDPGEMRNLGAQKGSHAPLVMTMNEKLNTVMDAEFGKDDGREMPDIANLDWTLDRFEL